MADPTTPNRGHLQPVSPFPLPELGQAELHLPRPLMCFVGRESEVAAVAAMLRRPGVRLVTLTGPGGVGKTRLAIRLAKELTDRFPEEVRFAALASVRDHSLIAATIAQVLGVQDGGARSVDAGLREYLRDRRLLLILDNFEHLLDAGP